MAYCPDVAGETGFKFDRVWIHLEIHQQFLAPALHFDAGEILDSFKREIILQRFELDVLAERKNIGFE